MKLLLDENFSRRLVAFLSDSFPGSTQVALLGLEQATDWQIWQYAKHNDFIIVTKDSDFVDLLTISGQPPKVIWLKMGNQSNAAIINALLTKQQAIEQVLMIDDKGGIEVYR